jgi:multidrug efflux pump subunit AcrA (membrane-fusion protein)
VAQVDTLAQPRDDDVPVQYFGVLLEFERTDAEVMKPGQRVQSVLTLEERTDVLTVPRQAVFEVRGHDVVYVRHGSRFEPAEVRVGPRGLGRVVIETGLAGGEEVALRDPTRAADGPEPEAEATGSVAVGGS